MMTVAQVSKRTGVSVRTLHHYDQIGLLKPTEVTDAGYRRYDDTALDKLYMILVYRELGLPLNEIGGILDASVIYILLTYPILTYIINLY